MVYCILACGHKYRKHFLFMFCRSISKWIPSSSWDVRMRRGHISSFSPSVKLCKWVGKGRTNKQRKCRQRYSKYSQKLRAKSRFANAPRGEAAPIAKRLTVLFILSRTSSMDELEWDSSKEKPRFFYIIWKCSGSVFYSPSWLVISAALNF